MATRQMTVSRLEPWDGVSYEDALEAQRRASLDARVGWHLFSCPPTITMGRRALESDLRVGRAELARRGVRVLAVDRGGEVTYHGPGQVIGFPFGRLEDHVGDPRGVRAFVEALKAKLSRLIRAHGHVLDESEAGGAGLWVNEVGLRRKIVSIGLAFGRHGIGHGFALNLQPLADEFALIHPCGARGAPPAASLFRVPRPRAEVDAVVAALVDILGAER